MKKQLISYLISTITDAGFSRNSHLTPFKKNRGNEIIASPVFSEQKLLYQLFIAESEKANQRRLT